MKDVIHPLHGLAHQLTVEDRAFDELMLQAGQIMPEAGAQVVQHADFGQPLKMLGDVTPDKTGAAGD